MFTWEPARAGVKKTLQMAFLMARIVLPVTLLVVGMERLELLAPMARFFYPLLRYFGLPGEAALALLLGYLLNIYAAIGALSALTLSAREVTVIAVIILTTHSLPMESPVLSFTGLPTWITIPLRIAAGLVMGVIVNYLFLLLGV